MEENEERLLEAAQNGEAETLKTLVGIGANVNAIGYSGMTALMHAVRNNHAACVKILLDAGADVNHINELGRTAIKMAEEKSYSDILKLLRIAKEASPVAVAKAVSSSPALGLSANATEPDKNSAATQTKAASALRTRYADAYAVAKTIVTFGQIVKTIGVVLAVLIFLGALITANTARGYGSQLNTAALMIGILAAVVVGVFFYLLGIFVSAQGQILSASLDSAVNSSPFLTQEQKARIMALL